MPQSPQVPEADWRELQAIVDEEINRLPEKYRGPLVLCGMQGKTQAEAARELVCPAGSLSRYLSQGRELLRRRLERRGLTFPAALAGTLLVGPVAGASLRPALVNVTVQSVRRFLESGAMGLSASVASLVAGGVQGLLSTKLKVLVVVVFASTITAAGMGLRSGPEATPGAPEQTNADVAEPGTFTEDQPARARTDFYGDPLPPGAIARLGTTRFRQGYTFGAVFSPDGKKIATVGNGLRIWDAATGKELLHVADQHQTTALAFSSDGKLIATETLVPRGENKWLLISALLDAGTGRIVHRLSEGDMQAVVFVFSPDGKKLAMGGFRPGATGLVIVWDTATGQILSRLEQRDLSVRALAFSPDGKILAGNDWSPGRKGGERQSDNRILLWHADRGAMATPLSGHKEPPLAVVFSPDGKLLASGGKDETVRVWDWGTRKQIRMLEAKHGDVHALTFSPDSRTLASGHDDGTVILWETATGRKIRAWNVGRVSSVSFSPDGKSLVSAGYATSGPRLWDPATGKERFAFPGHHNPSTQLAFTDRKKLISVSLEDRCVLEWNLASGRPREVFAWKQGRGAPKVSSDGNKLASIEPDNGILKMWDLPRGTARILATYGKTANAYCARFSPDGRFLALHVKGQLHLWDSRNVKASRGFASRYVAFSPDGKVVAWANEDARTIHLQDLSTGEELGKIESLDAIGDLGFSPDGRYLYSQGSDDKSSLQVWNLETGKSRTLRETGSEQWAFSPDGRYLAVNDNFFARERSTHVFELLTGTEICHFDGYAYSFAFSPDGRELAGGIENSNILIWDLTGRLDKDRLRPALLTAQQLTAAWNDLAGADGPKAHQAIWKLAAAPKQTIALLKDRLRPVTPTAADRMAVLLRDLDDAHLAVREKAGDDLAKLGAGCLPDLRKALKKDLSRGMRRRVEKVIGRITNAGPEQWQALRAVTVLEQMDTPEARQLLQALAGGIADARLTQDARASLARLSGSSIVLPVRELVGSWPIVE